LNPHDCKITQFYALYFCGGKSPLHLMKSLSRTSLVFYLMVCYVFLQFLWWFFLMNSLNREVYHLRVHEGAQLELMAKLNKRKRMFLAEGLVFMAVLGIGVVQLRRSLKQETRLLRQQKNFLMSVTHELKSPLASLRLQAETLVKRDLEKERMKQIARHSLEEVDRLTRLTDHILLATQIENSRMEQHPENIRVAETIEKLLQARFAENPKEFSRIHTCFSPALPDCRMDAVSFSSIVLNLVENALKYSPQESPVKVTAYTENPWMHLLISDRGQGIPQEYREQIFQKFFRIGNEETRASKGTGLGLYIVKHLVELSGGSIVPENNPEGGTVFHVTLPLS